MTTTRPFMLDLRDNNNYKVREKLAQLIRMRLYIMVRLLICFTPIAGLADEPTQLAHWNYETYDDNSLLTYAAHIAGVKVDAQLCKTPIEEYGGQVDLAEFIMNERAGQTEYNQQYMQDTEHKDVDRYLLERQQKPSSLHCCKISDQINGLAFWSAAEGGAYIRKLHHP